MSWVRYACKAASEAAREMHKDWPARKHARRPHPHGRALAHRPCSQGIALARRAAAMLAAAFALALLVAPAPASAIDITWTDDSPFYFYLYGGGYGQYRFRNADTGEIVYCITPDVDAPLGECPISYEASAKLTNLLLHGYPARASFGSLTQDQWENCTQLAIWCAYGGKPRQDFECSYAGMFDAVDYLIGKYNAPVGDFINTSGPEGSAALPQLFDAAKGLWRCGPYKVECELGYGGIKAVLDTAPDGAYVGDASGNAMDGIASNKDFYVYLPAAAIAPAAEGSASSGSDSTEAKVPRHAPLSMQASVTATGVQSTYLCWRSATAGLQDLVSTTTVPISETRTFASTWGILDFRKESEDGIGLSQRFRLTGPSTDTMFTTDDNGCWRSGPLIPGTYSITELDTPGRYEPRPTQEVEIAGEVSTGFTIRNTLKRGSIEIAKKSWKDADDAMFRFAISGKDTGFYSEVEATVDSPATVENLLCDTYTITEIGVDERDYILPAPIEVEITEGNWNEKASVVFENNEALPKLIIKKKSEDAVDVSGTMFKVVGEKGWSKIVTIPKGSSQIEVELPARDTYTVSEINIPSRYNAQLDQTVEAILGTVYEVDFSNTLKPATPTPGKTVTPTPDPASTPIVTTTLPKTGDHLVFMMAAAIAAVAFAYCCAICAIFYRKKDDAQKNMGRHSRRSGANALRQP